MKFILTLEQYLSSINEVRKYENVPQPLIDKYAKKFKEINSNKKLIDYASKNLPHIKNPLDINQYVNFKDLETVVDYFSVSKPVDISELSSNTDSIYNKDNIQVFLADTKDKCIRYGKGTKWCIARTGANMFYHYRLSPEYKDYTFYFIYNNNLPLTDKHSKIVIHSYYNIGGSDSDSVHYKCTNLNNDDIEYKSNYQDLVKDIPYLKNLQSLFVPIPFSEEEKEASNLPSRIKDIDLYKILGSWKKVEYYITLNQISEKQLLNLPDTLQKQALDAYLLSHRPEFKLYKMLSNDVKKYFLYVFKREIISNGLYGGDIFLKELRNDEYTFDIAKFYMTKNDGIRHIIECFNTVEYLYKFIDEIIKMNKSIPFIPTLAYSSREFIKILIYDRSNGNRRPIDMNHFLSVVDVEFDTQECNVIKKWVGSEKTISVKTIQLLIKRNIYNKKDINFFIGKVRNLTDLEELLDVVGGVDDIDQSVLSKVMYNLKKL